ncbi:transcriptional regulator (plasmid) [Bacillus thuringiensis LM1212]|uniref:Transcriptional regulator n=2 Tax=Bacillus cereus group TaxID=86661 RepID=A0A9X7QNE1_BACCE|nr:MULTISPECIES: metalloregulator ArsR/SmtB family transcription factor [Bacillus cereus group]QDF27143.1 helix-turn-helix transcriptional regulator [Bacillus tropicus]AXY11237.1 transcriptional regulator [Bacillus thuringiensis LM1212]MBG9613768.1 ArsR family transcriptional regulator [Bacillus cereus]MED3470269.1 metalloregulator ArsR/SmtB family transcription factor [Bacillus thuringiensis]OUB50342.1 transcriptional regulator [Bacillus thuringiensis serovar higo]
MTNVFYMELNNLDLELERSAEILRVLAHPTRLQIVHQLVEKKALNVSALQHFLNLPQSTVSQHLHKMRNHKVLLHERKGTEVFYRVDDEKVKQTVKILMCK